MNLVILTQARLGANPEKRTTQAGAKVTTGRVCTTEYSKQGTEWKEYPTWHTIVCWGDNADTFAGMAKGDQVEFNGRIEYREYEKKDGTKGFSTELVGHVKRTIKFGEKSAGESRPEQRQETNTQMDIRLPEPDEIEAEGNDLPF